MIRKSTDPLRVRLNTTAPRPSFVDDDEGDYLVSYSPLAASPAPDPGAGSPSIETRSTR